MLRNVPSVRFVGDEVSNPIEDLKRHTLFIPYVLNGWYNVSVASSWIIQPDDYYVVHSNKLNTPLVSTGRELELDMVQASEQERLYVQNIYVMDGN